MNNIPIGYYYPKTTNDINQIKHTVRKIKNVAKCSPSPIEMAKSRGLGLGQSLCANQLPREQNTENHLENQFVHRSTKNPQTGHNFFLSNNKKQPTPNSQYLRPINYCSKTSLREFLYD